MESIPSTFAFYHAVSGHKLVIMILEIGPELAKSFLGNEEPMLVIRN